MKDHGKLYILVQIGPKLDEKKKKKKKKVIVISLKYFCKPCILEQIRQKSNESKKVIVTSLKDFFV